MNIARPRIPEDTCVHEAAHAIIAHCLGAKVRGLNWNGKVGAKSRGWTYMDFSVNRKKLDPIVDCCVTMAGHVAEVAWCGRDVTLWPKGDYLHIQSRGISWRGGNILFPIVRKWLKEEKRFVFALARALEERKDLTRRQFLAVLRKTANQSAIKEK